MKSVKPWVDALGVPQEDYQRWCKEVPSDSSVTYWCLAQGRIPAGAYLQWASEHYGLAVLRPEFFENPPNRDIYRTLKSVANWSREMIPIHQWDGVIFIACVEPVDEVKWSFPVCFVLASSAELDAYWNALNEKTAVGAAPPPPPELTKTPYPEMPNVPVNATAAPPPPEWTMTNVTAIRPDVQVPPPEPAATSTPAAEPDAPGGLNLNLGTPGRKERDFLAELASQVGNEDEIPTQAKPMPSVDSEMPAGLNLNIAPPPMPDNTFTAINLQVSTPTPSVPEGLAVTPPAGDASGTASAGTPPAKPTMVPPTTEGTPAAVNVAPTAMSEQARIFGEQFFRDMRGEFEGAMILTFDNNRLTPWSWDENFAPPAHQGPGVDLSKPSAFRIAFRTKMPYLGHVVETPTNTEFFAGWGYSQLPENIIAYPMLFNGTFLGVLLLKAKKSQKHTQLLSSSEQYAQRIAHALAQIKGTKAA